MQGVILVVALVAALAGVAAAVWAMVKAGRGELREDMSREESLLMSGESLRRPGATPLYERTFGRKQTLVKEEVQVSWSWAEWGRRLRSGDRMAILVVVGMALGFLAGAVAIASFIADIWRSLP